MLERRPRQPRSGILLMWARAREANAASDNGGDVLAAERLEKGGHPGVLPGLGTRRLYFTQGQPPR